MRTKHGRCKGTGTVYKSGGRWYGRITVHGKRTTIPTQCTTREDAVRFMDKYTVPFRAAENRAKLEHIASEIRLIDGDIDEARRRANDLPLDMAWQKAVEGKQLATSTKWHYKAAFTLLRKFVALRRLDVMRMSQITLSIAEEFRDYAAERYRPSTARLHLETLKTSWMLISDPDGRGNPWRGLTVPGRKRPIGNLTDGELEAVMQSARRRDGDYAFLFELAANTCMRLSDCCLLRWENIDMKRRVITFVPHKLRRHGKSVHLPMSRRVCEIIASRAGDGPQAGYVSPRLARHYMNCSIRRILLQIFASAGIPPHTNRSFHSLRVHGITRLLENGIPLATVQAIAGHASPEMTQHYYRLDVERTRAALDGLDMCTYRRVGNTIRADTVTITTEEYHRLKAYEALLRSAALDRLGGSSPASTTPPLPALPGPQTTSCSTPPRTP